MPTDVVEYLNKFGLFGGGVLFYWALSTGRIYLKREVDFIKENDKTTIDDLKHQLLRANEEVDASRVLMNKVVDQALKDRQNI